MKVLLTGGAGFVGSHAIRHLLANTDWEIVAPVSFRHRGLSRRIESSICDMPEADRLTIVHWDMRSPADFHQLSQFAGCEAIWNIASESHVDRSIEDPLGFVSNNTLMMLNILSVARSIQPGLFLQMSTDEVYGPALGAYRHNEWDTIAPSNPYAASKAAQEAIAFSFWRTYDVPVVITNTMNILGEMQDPEKFLPMIIRNVRDGRPVTVHASPDNVPGSRFYLHARNLADAWWCLTSKILLGDHVNGGMMTGYGPLHPETGQVEETLHYSDGGIRPMRFHIVGEQEIRNDHLVSLVAEMMTATPLMEYVSFHKSRPGHDLRYALDGQRMRSIGWEPPMPLLPSLEKTVAWYLAHPEWLDG